MHPDSRARYVVKVPEGAVLATVNIIFETGSGPAGDYRYDWAGWGTPKLVVY